MLDQAVELLGGERELEVLGRGWRVIGPAVLGVGRPDGLLERLDAGLDLREPLRRELDRFDHDRLLGGEVVQDVTRREVAADDDHQHQEHEPDGRDQAAPEQAAASLTLFFERLLGRHPRGVEPRVVDFVVAQRIGSDSAS